MFKKRLTSIFLSILIVIGVLASDYCTVMAVDLPTAFWGTLEASRAWFTAMQAGGAFDRGISFNQFVNTTSSQWQEVQRKTMDAFKLYLYYRYQLDLTEKFPSMSVEDIRNEAIRLGTITYNSFVENAINVTNTTKEGITVQDFKYWQGFCKEFRSVAKNGLGSGGDIIGDNTEIQAKIINKYDIDITATQLKNVGANTFVYNDKYYIYNGKFNNKNLSYENVPTDRIRIGFAHIDQARNGTVYLMKEFIDVNRLSGEKIAYGRDDTYELGNNLQNIVNDIVSNTNFPIMIISSSDSEYESYLNDYENSFAIGNGSSQQTLDWQYGIDDSLQNTAGESIKDGNTKQHTKTIVKEGSVPVKRSSLKEEERNGEKVVSGEIGWDIPKTEVITAPIIDDTKEDEFIEDIGIIDVPEDVVIDDPVPGEIVIPGEEEIVIPVTPDVPIPIIKLLELQYGPFYPTSMDITEFFPFCIPFDFAYCVNKFRVGEGEAPVIDFPIVYPKKLQPILGESYHVVIDFNDYIFLRNIIRYFLLLSFITGLMFATRSLIRG